VVKVDRLRLPRDSGEPSRAGRHVVAAHRAERAGHGDLGGTSLCNSHAHGEARGLDRIARDAAHGEIVSAWSRPVARPVHNSYATV
jgi:hypothetical protein